MFMKSLFLDVVCLCIVLTLISMLIWGFADILNVAIAIEIVAFVGWVLWFLIARPNAIRFAPSWLSTLNILLFMAWGVGQFIVERG